MSQPSADAPRTAAPATTWRALLFGLLLFALVDAAVFRSGLYTWLAKVDSSGGWVALRTQYEPRLWPPASPPNVVLFGDSRVTEGCDERALAAALGLPEAAVRDLAMPGSSPRVWPFEFAAVPPPAGGWSVVVVALTGYGEVGEGLDTEDPTQRRHDLSFLMPLLGIGEAWRLAGDFDDGGAQRDLRLASLVRAFAWRNDVRDLLQAPVARYREVRHRFGRLRWGAGYEGNPRSLAGVHVEGDRLVGLPAELASEAPALRRLVWPKPGAPQTGYRRRWLGRLVDLAAERGADVVFVRMPTRVLPPEVPTPPPPRDPALVELAQRPRVHVLAEDLFAELEHPEFFADVLHLNRVGRQRWTALLSGALRATFPERFGR